MNKEGFCIPWGMLGWKALGFILMSLGGFIVWNAVNEGGFSLNVLLSVWYSVPIVMSGLFITWGLIYGRIEDGLGFFSYPT